MKNIRRIFANFDKKTEDQFIFRVKWDIIANKADSAMAPLPIISSKDQL